MTSAPAMLLALLLSLAPLGTPDRGQLGPPPAARHPQGLLPVNPDYFSLSAETGGDFYFWAPGEFATAGLQIPLHDEAVTLAYGTLPPQGVRLAIPVESGARRLTVFAGAQRKDQFRLLRPDGRPAAGAGVALQAFSHMLIASVDAPAAGTWQLELRGAGQYSTSAHVAATREVQGPAFLGLDFVEMGGRPGHEGWFPIERDLRRGERLTCSAKLAGASGPVEFGFVGRDGASLGTLALRQEEPGGDYLGACEVPMLAFRTMARGADASGQSFQRIEPALRSPR
jgi:hypothetical protein